MSNAMIADAMLALAPPWLGDDSPVTASNPQGGVSGRYVWGPLGLMNDALIDKMFMGTCARLPLGGTTGPSGGNGGPFDDALALLGADRVIVRGIGESAQSYGGRLQRAFPTWQHAGQAITVMTEALDYLQTECRAAVVNVPIAHGFPVVYSAHVTEFSAGADTSLPPARWLAGWKWDTGYGLGGANGAINGYDSHPLTMANAWWRAWLVLWAVAPNAWTAAGPVWGAGQGWVWGDTKRSWGLSVPATTISTIRTIVGTWKSAHTWYRWIVVSLNANFLNWGDGAATYPTDATWQHWGKVATATNLDGTVVPAYVPARDANLRYCDGVINAGVN